MSSTPSQPDSNAFKQWPEEVLKIYGQLPLPSLYEFVIAQEKVAGELRRQSKDMHKLVAAIIALRDQVKGLDEHLQMEVVDLEGMSSDSQEGELPLPKITGESDEPAEPGDGFYPAWEVDMMRQAGKLEQRQWEEIYIAMLEIILQTFDENDMTTNKAMDVLHESKLSRGVESALQQLFNQHNNKVQSIRDQMLAHLKDIDLEPITPMPGELYNEDIHRVIETLPLTDTKGGKHRRNTIARVIRIGYRRHSELVRQADVCIYG